MRMPRLGNSRGSGMILSLLSLIVFVIMTTAIVTSLVALKKQSIYQQGLLQAESIADACVQETLLKLESNKNYSTSISGRVLGDGYYNAQFNVAVASLPVVTCSGYGQNIALLGRPFRTIRFTAEFLPNVLINGLLANSADNDPGLTTGSQYTYIDTYNSSTDQNYASPTSSANVQVNGSVSLYNSQQQIKGNLKYNSGSAPTSGNSSRQVTGSATSHQTFTFPTISVTASATNNDNLKGGITPASDYNSSTMDLLVPVNTTATITSGTYYFRKLSLDYLDHSHHGHHTYFGTLNLNITNGPVVIYVTDSLNMHGEICNPTLRPGNLYIYGTSSTSQSVTIYSQGCDFYGVLVGQHMAVNLQSTMWGAIAADSVNLVDTTPVDVDVGILHEDLDVATSANNNDPVRVKPGTWKFLDKKF